MNIVFDLGGVVFNWQPDLVVKNAFDDPNMQELVRWEVIDHPDWLELDRGALDLEVAITNAVKRTGISKSTLSEFFDYVVTTLTPIQETIDLIHELAGNANHDLFVLSNMHKTSIHYLESNYDFWDLFRARTISCRIKMVKPEPEIFRHLLDSNSLAPQDTIFVDDMLANTQAAEAFGIRTIHFRNTSKCREELEEMGCL